MTEIASFFSHWCSELNIPIDKIAINRLPYKPKFMHGDGSIIYDNKIEKYVITIHPETSEAIYLHELSHILFFRDLGLFCYGNDYDPPNKELQHIKSKVEDLFSDYRLKHIDSFRKLRFVGFMDFLLGKITLKQSPLFEGLFIFFSIPFYIELLFTLEEKRILKKVYKGYISKTYEKLNKGYYPIELPILMNLFSTFYKRVIRLIDKPDLKDYMKLTYDILVYLNVYEENEVKEFLENWYEVKVC